MLVSNRKEKQYERSQYCSLCVVGSLFSGLVYERARLKSVIDGYLPDMQGEECVAVDTDSMMRALTMHQNMLNGHVQHARERTTSIDAEALLSMSVFTRTNGVGNEPSIVTFGPTNIGVAMVEDLSVNKDIPGILVAVMTEDPEVNIERCRKLGLADCVPGQVIVDSHKMVISPVRRLIDTVSTAIVFDASEEDADGNVIFRPCVVKSVDKFEQFLVLPGGYSVKWVEDHFG